MNLYTESQVADIHKQTSSMKMENTILAV